MHASVVQILKAELGRSCSLPATSSHMSCRAEVLRWPASAYICMCVKWVGGGGFHWVLYIRCAVLVLKARVRFVVAVLQDCDGDTQACFKKTAMWSL